MRDNTTVSSKWLGDSFYSRQLPEDPAQKPVGAAAAPVADVTVRSCRGVSGGSWSLPVSGRRSCLPRLSRPLEAAAVSLAGPEHEGHRCEGK